jgi:hypothetical protein
MSRHIQRSDYGWSAYRLKSGLSPGLSDACGNFVGVGLLFSSMLKLLATDWYPFPSL